MERIIKGSFDEYGFPYLNLQVCNQQQQVSVPAKAIIDTGGAHCLVREEIAIQLKLEELRVADYLHPVFGKMPLKEYIMDLCLTNNNENNETVIKGIRAGTLIDPNYPASVVIGVEVLRHCKFEYDGRNETFIMTVFL